MNETQNTHLGQLGHFFSPFLPTVGALILAFSPPLFWLQYPSQLFLDAEKAKIEVFFLPEQTLCFNQF